MSDRRHPKGTTVEDRLNGRRTQALQDVSLIDRLLHSLDSISRERFTLPATVHAEWSDRADRDGTDALEAAGFELDPENWIRIELESGPAHETRYREFDLEYVRNAWVCEHDGNVRLLHSESDASLAAWRREFGEGQDHV